MEYPFEQQQTLIKKLLNTYYVLFPTLTKHTANVNCIIDTIIVGGCKQDHDVLGVDLGYDGVFSADMMLQTTNKWKTITGQINIVRVLTVDETTKEENRIYFTITEFGHLFISMENSSIVGTIDHENNQLVLNHYDSLFTNIVCQIMRNTKLKGFVIKNDKLVKNVNFSKNLLFLLPHPNFGHKFLTAETFVVYPVDHYGIDMVEFLYCNLNDALVIVEMQIWNEGTFMEIINYALSSIHPKVEWVIYHRTSYMDFIENLIIDSDFVLHDNKYIYKIK